MAFHGTPVEVRKHQKSTTWYSGELIDINGEDSIKVRFEDDIWDIREVPASSVRRLPEDGANDDFDPQVEEVVEVLLPATESTPSGWGLGTVKTIKNSFYFITFDPTQKGKQDLIVERSALRRCSREEKLDVSSVVRTLLPVESDLHSWIRSQDSSGCLNHVQHKCNLLVANCTNVEGSHSSPEVLLIGGAREVRLATMLLELIHFKHQIEMQRFHEHRDHLTERLDRQKQWHSAQHQEVFEVDQSLVGRIIGKKGENVKVIREKHNVQIWIEDPRKNSTICRVTVSGSTEKAVKSARDELEFITVTIPVESEHVGWILGKGYQTITDIARKTELHHARYDDKSRALELCGLRHQVEDAKLLISVHQEYLPVYQDMDEEQHAIQQSFDQLDGVANSKGKGKKGKGENMKGDGKGEDGKTGRKDGDSKGGKSKDGKDGKDGKGSKREDQSEWYGRKGKDGKDGKDSKVGKDSGKGKESGKEGKDGGKNGGKDGWRGSKGEGKEGKDGWRGKDGGKDGGKDSWGGKDGKDGKDGKGKEGKEGKDGKGDGKERKGKGSKDGREKGDEKGEGNWKRKDHGSYEYGKGEKDGKGKGKKGRGGEE